MDNDHGPMDHSPKVPLYSTLFLLSKLGIMIIPLFNLSLLIETTHITINKKDWVFGHLSSTPWYCDASFLSYIGPQTFTLQAALFMHACLPLLPEASTHFPGSKQH